MPDCLNLANDSGYVELILNAIREDGSFGKPNIGLKKRIEGKDSVAAGHHHRPGCR